MISEATKRHLRRHLLSAYHAVNNARDMLEYEDYEEALYYIDKAEDNLGNARSNLNLVLVMEQREKGQ